MVKCVFPKPGKLETFDSLEKIVEAWEKQVDFTQKILARRHAMEVGVLAKSAAFNVLSILSDDCMERGKALFNGGARYVGGIIESFGLTNTAG